jgi:antitoxin VapB
MVLNIKSDKAHEVARAVAHGTGETVAEAVTRARARRLDEVERSTGVAVLEAEVREIQDFVRSLPERDTRAADEIIGYDEFGLPK